MAISGVEALAAYFAFFALVHSFLADPRFKSWGRKTFGDAFDRWQRLAYTVLALIMILPFIYILAYLPDRILYIVPWPGSGLMVACQALAALALLASLRQTGISSFLGLAETRALERRRRAGHEWLLLPPQKSALLLCRPLPLAQPHHDPESAGVQHPGHILLLHWSAARGAVAA